MSTPVLPDLAAGAGADPPHAARAASSAGPGRPRENRTLVARVLVDSPLPQLDRLFDYAIPRPLEGTVAAGMRVRVPLRSAGRIADGIVVELSPAGDYSGPLSELDDLVSPVPVLAPEVWTLARRVADRAAGTANDVVRLAVPKRQVRVEKAWLAERDTAQPAAVPSASGHDQQSSTAALALLGYPLAQVTTAIAGGGRLAVDAVARLLELPDGRSVGHWAVTMAAAATAAIDTGGSVILCVPDFRDQDQLMAALYAVLPAEQVVRLDARQSGPERYRAHLACLGADPLVIVGNRSVLYAPAQRLALIAVWDDGDDLHSEPLSPYAHSRDVALLRQNLQSCSLWFLAHARSTEVERLVELGFLDVLTTERSYTPRVVPTAQQAPQDRFAALARIPSTAWREARAALDHGPVLVQVARPGYSPAMACATCANPARCPACEGPLASRTARAVPACAWCGALAASWVCPTCDGTTMKHLGQGAVRTADDLGRAFPGVRVIVADGEHPILRVDGSRALVIATRGAEPVADGGYHAILLLDGERMLARESLRVGEDCLRLWCNAAALAKPGAPVVLVGVGGSLASAMATWRPEVYAAAELVDRRRLRFPPAVRVATVTGDVAMVEKAVLALSEVDHTDVLGPVEVVSGGVRAIVRFDYARGSAVASALRAEVIRAATTRRKRLSGTASRGALPTLKVRFDDLEPFRE